MLARHQKAPVPTEGNAMSMPETASVPAAMSEPCHDIAHLGHVEMYTDRYARPAFFFTEIYGLTLTAEDETSA